MCFHWGVLTLGKCNRLEYQPDVPQSVTAHLSSESWGLRSDKHSDKSQRKPPGGLEG